MEKFKLYITLSLVFVLQFPGALCQDIFDNTAETYVTSAELKTADFSSKGKIEEFIFNKIFTKSDITTRGTLNLWNTDGEKRNLEESAIIFLRHPYDNSRLNPDASVETTLPPQITDLRSKIRNAQNLLIKVRINTIQQSEYTDLIGNFDLFSTEEQTAFGNRTYADQFQRDNFSRQNFILMLEGKLKILEERLSAKQTEYDNKKEAIVEKPEIITTLLHKENGDWSDYLLETREILLVLLGGEDSFSKADVTIENNLSEFESSFNDLKDLASQLGIPLSGSDKIKCKVIYLKKSRLRPPSVISLKHSSFKEDIKYKLHESGIFTFKVGVSASQVEKTDFKIEDEQLIVSLDEEGQERWQENLIVMLEGSFLPRDYDRFGSFFKKDGKEMFWNRWGYFIGCKLSKRPWDLLAAGLSFSLTKDISLNFGTSIVLQEKEQTVEIGNIISLDEAKELADLEYTNPRLFLGISFAPRIITKALGLGSDKTD